MQINHSRDVVGKIVHKKRTEVSAGY